MIKRIIRSLTLLLVCPLLFCGCNQEDDVMEIFNSGVWNFVNYYAQVDWDSNNDRLAVPEYKDINELNEISKFTIKFESDGTFNGNLLSGGTYSGRWEAHPEDRTFMIVGEVSSNITLTGKNREFITRLKACKFYRGDSKIMLRLAPESRTTCLQFTHRK